MNEPRRRSGVAVLAVALAIGSGGALADEADGSLVERGRYLARAADCHSCHTASGGEPYAGGEGFPTPFGRLYAPNITQHDETGIGAWTREDFEGALRGGVGRDGSPLYPAMPYTAYTRLTDDDVDALFAYFETVEPVDREVPENRLTFPFDLRAGVGVWQSMFFDEGRFEPDPERDATWNSGAYLVRALGHCGACHTPRNAALAEDEARALTGSQIEHWYAPDISGSEQSVLHDWEVEELVRYFKGEEGVRNIATIGPMEAVIRESLAHLREEDLRAMAIYLKNQPPPEEAPEPPEDFSTSKERFAAGEQLYTMHCAGCHERDGEGIEGGAPTLVDNAAVTARKPYNLLSAILNGFEAGDGYGGMPGFAAVMSDRQVSDVANFVRMSWSNAAEPNVTPWLVATWRNEAGAGDYGEGGEPRLVCPVIGDDVIDAATRDALRTAHRTGGARDGVRAAVERFREAHPDSTSSDVVNRLTAAYCNLVAQDDLSYREKSADLVGFMGGVAAISAKD